MKTPLILFAVVGLVCPGPAQDRSNRDSDSIFEPDGIEWSETQKEKIEQLREEVSAELANLRQQQGGIRSPEQQQAERDAFEMSRDSGKSRLEAQQAGREAANLSEEQQEQLASLQRQRRELLNKAREDVQALMTEEQRKNVPDREAARRPGDQSGIEPTHADLKYGPAERNVMDVWLAESDTPTPVLVSIHGGGFQSGNKRIGSSLLRQCLDAGISAVAITYRLTDEAIAPAQMMDSARAIQFIRHHAEKWNIDPEKIAATGGSAGAGISLWLGFHDDLADPDNEDPVLRESTRLTCMYVENGQTSYDPRFILDMFPDAQVHRIGALQRLFGSELRDLEQLPEEKKELFEKISPLAHLTKDDPPAALTYSRAMDSQPDIHHPLFGKLLKEKMDELGIRCEVYVEGEALGGGERLSTFEFIRQEFEREGEQ